MCDRPDTVRHFKSLWLQLSDLTREFGNAMGFSRACYLLMFFVQDVLAVYGLTSNMERGFDSVNSTFAISAVVFTYGIFVICDGGHSATEQVARQLTSFRKFLARFLHACLGLCRYTWMAYIKKEDPHISFCLHKTEIKERNTRTVECTTCMWEWEIHTKRNLGIQREECL